MICLRSLVSTLFNNHFVGRVYGISLCHADILSYILSLALIIRCSLRRNNWRLMLRYKVTLKQEFLVIFIVLFHQFRQLKTAISIRVDHIRLLLLCFNWLFTFWAISSHSWACKLLCIVIWRSWLPIILLLWCSITSINFKTVMLRIRDLFLTCHLKLVCLRLFNIKISWN